MVMSALSEKVQKECAKPIGSEIEVPIQQIYKTM